MLFQFWQSSFLYPADSYIFDGTGNIQYTAAGGISGVNPPVWTTTTTDDGFVAWVFVGFGGRALELQRAQNPIGPYNEFLNDAVSYSRGVLDAGKFVLLNSSGQIDLSMGGILAGVAVITESVAQAVAFAQNFTGAQPPVVVLTPTSAPALAGSPPVAISYWITYTGVAGAWTGFVVHIDDIATVSFNYVVVENQS